MIKAVILVGGPQKGTRFRPLSLNNPKPLFPIAGFLMIEHLIKLCLRGPEVKEIILIGFYHLDDFMHFISSMIEKYGVDIRYLQEYAPLGTAGGVYHFRDIICLGHPEAIILINGDVCGNFNLVEMLKFHNSLPETKLITIMGTETTRSQSIEYGCIVENQETHEMLHYVEKPDTFISTTINCGVYIFSSKLMDNLSEIFKIKHASNSYDVYLPNDLILRKAYSESISFEKDVLMRLIESKRVYVFKQKENFWWNSIKTPSSAIYANKSYLSFYRKFQPDLLVSSKVNGPTIIGDVYIHPTAIIDSSATIGPNVSINENVKIGSGVRIKESIILKNVTINDNSVIIYSILGWNCAIGYWSRVEGNAGDSKQDQAFSKLENLPLFDKKGKLNPSITVLGNNVQVASEIIILNSIVLPHKEISRSYKNEIIL